MRFTSIIIIIITFCFELNAQQFLASSYPSDYHGTVLVSGDRYSKFIETAANNDIPIGSKILITEKNTKRSVLVTINDLIEEPTVDFLLSDAVYIELGLDRNKKILVTYKLISTNTRDYAIVDQRSDRLSPKGISDKISIESLTNINSLAKELFVIQIGAFSNKEGITEYINANPLLSKNIDKISWFLNTETKLIKVSYGIFSDRNEANLLKGILAKSNIKGYTKQVGSY